MPSLTPSVNPNYRVLCRFHAPQPLHGDSLCGVDCSDTFSSTSPAWAGASSRRAGGYRVEGGDRQRWALKRPRWRLTDSLRWWTDYVRGFRRRAVRRLSAAGIPVQATQRPPPPPPSSSGGPRTGPLGPDLRAPSFPKRGGPQTAGVMGPLRFGDPEKTAPQRETPAPSPQNGLWWMGCGGTPPFLPGPARPPRAPARHRPAESRPAAPGFPWPVPLTPSPPPPPARATPSSEQEHALFPSTSTWGGRRGGSAASCFCADPRAHNVWDRN